MKNFRVLRAMFRIKFQLVIAALVVLSFNAGPQALAQDQGSDLVDQNPEQEDLGPPIGFYSFMNSGELTVVIESGASATADLVLDRNTLELSWDISWQDFNSSVTAVHIHGPGRPGELATVALDLSDGISGRTSTGKKVLPPGLLAHILTGRAYVDIHSRRFPDAEVRGKIERLHPTRGKIESPHQ